jgi:hypothetical protein
LPFGVGDQCDLANVVARRIDDNDVEPGADRGQRGGCGHLAIRKIAGQHVPERRSTSAAGDDLVDLDAFVGEEAFLRRHCPGQRGSHASVLADHKLGRPRPRRDKQQQRGQCSREPEMTDAHLLSPRF